MSSSSDQATPCFPDQVQHQLQGGEGDVRDDDHEKQDADDDDGDDKGNDEGGWGGVAVVVMVWVVVAWSRVMYVSNPLNWWVLHPDENFQSMEVAHTLAYGYGFRPYEFSSLTEGRVNSSDEQVSLYRQRELQLGMSRMRSALYPRFYVVISCLAAIFRPGVTPFVLWKVVHTLVSSLLPLSVFRFTKAYFHSHDAACLAAILVSTSAHLNVFGTHPLLNSFLSPAVFWSLSQLLPLVRGSETWKSGSDSCDSHHDSQLNKSRFCLSLKAGHLTDLQRLFLPWKAVSPNKLDATKTTNGNQTESCVEWSAKASLRSTRKGKTRCAGIQVSPSQHLKRKTTVTPKHQCETSCHHPSERKSHSAATSHFLYSGIVRKILGVDFIHKTSNSEEFVHCLCGFVLALCMYMRVDIALFSSVVLLPVYRPTRASYCQLLVCAAGFLAGIGLGVLEDFFFYGAVVLSPGNWSWFNVLHNMSGELFGGSSPWKYLVSLWANNVALPCFTVLHGVAFICVIIHTLHAVVAKSGSHCDHCEHNYTMWTTGHTSGNINTTNTSASNAKEKKGMKHRVSNKAMKIGTLNNNVENGAYLKNVKSRSLNTGKNGNESFLSTIQTRTLTNSKEPDDLKQRHSANLLQTGSCSPVAMSSSAVALTVCWVLLLVFYSCKDHKELRFIHNPLVLMLITSASLLSTAKQCLQKKLPTVPTQGLVCLVLLLWAGDQWRCFPASSSSTCTRPWAYQSITNSQDVNACLAYLADQTDVTGVFLDSPFHVTGGYSLLHHDVPLLTLLVQEFVEFDVSKKVTLDQTSALDSSTNVSYVTVDRLSNFVAVQNAGYLVKLLIQNRQYNYLILARDRQFLHTGYQQVFEHGAMRVLRRTFDPRQEQQLQALAARVPVGLNATVLKYEGDVLFRFHRFQLALERYMASFQLNPAHAQIFQVIAACKSRLGDPSEAEQWINACVQQFGIKDCSRPLTVISVNPDRPLL